MIIRVKEGELTWLQSLSVADMPHPLPSGINLHVRGQQVGLEAQGLAGAIPLPNGDTLQIVPKIGHVNFLRLLFKAEGTQRDLSTEYDEFVRYSLEDHENVDFVVARSLLLAAEEIMRRSPQQGRIAMRSRGSYASGGIDVAATALNIASHQEEPIVSFVKERTVDTPENRVITEAVVRAWLTVRENVADLKLRNVKDRWMTRFPRSKNVTEDLAYVERGFAASRYGGARDYYRRALMLAQVTLGSQGLGLAEASLVEGDAVLLNTADIFEKYLRNTISEAYKQAGYIVAKGGVGSVSLYTDGSFELNPDIFITKNGKPILIADAKYKVPDASDHYQMQVYLTANKVKSGLLLSPLFDGTEVVVREYATADKTVVREAYLPMQDLASTEEFLATVIDRFPQ